VSRISSIDTAGVQLLLAVRREAELRGMPLRFLGESAALARALERLGLAASLPMAHADAG
jgi:anti-anti-sigma regulatory factor